MGWQDLGFIVDFPWFDPHLSLVSLNYSMIEALCRHHTHYVEIFSKHDRLPLTDHFPTDCRVEFAPTPGLPPLPPFRLHFPKEKPFLGSKDNEDVQPGARAGALYSFFSIFPFLSFLQIVSTPSLERVSLISQNWTGNIVHLILLRLPSN